MTFGSSWSSNGSQRAAQRCDLELVAVDRQQMVHAQPAAALRSWGASCEHPIAGERAADRAGCAQLCAAPAARATGSGLRNAGAGERRAR
jgi:hypothetical protein